MKKSKMIGSVGLALTILFYVTILMLPREAEAKPKVVAIEGISYNVNSSLADNLKSLIGKKVYVTLNSGKTFTGKMFIDASYEGDLMAAAGVSYHVGREACSVYNEQWNGVQASVFHHGHYFKMNIDPYPKKKQMKKT